MNDIKLYNLDGLKTWVKWKMLKYFLLSIYIIIWTSWNLSTLDKNPLPWYDDTYFASVSKSLLESGQLIPTVVYSVNDHQPVYHYGPLYFSLGALSFKLFGFGIFQFRIVNFCFTLLLLLVSYLIIKKLTKNENQGILVSVLLSLDPFLGVTSHEGRMEIMVCFLILLAFYLLLNSSKQVSIYLSAFLVGLGILTTSRVIFFLPAFGVFLAMTNISKIKIGTWLFVAALPLLFWLILSFGSIDHFLKYINHKNSQESMGYFFNMNWPIYIPSHSILLIVLALIASILVIYLNPSIVTSKQFVFFVLSVICYYVLVVDYGPYSILILPFFYFAVMIAAQHIPNWISYTVLILLFSFNLSYTVLKSSLVFQTLEMRGSERIEKFIRDVIPMNSRVVADSPLFFAVENSGSIFQYIDHFGNDVKWREQKLISDFDFDYLILTDQFKLRSADQSDYLLGTGKYVYVSRFEVPIPKVKLPFGLENRFSNLENSTGYNCTVYKRIK